jgi:hypothetical protein
MPAAEVRRRGDRLRRRNAALVVGGAALAVALVAIPIAVVAGDDDAGRPQPAKPGLTGNMLLTADELPARQRLNDWRETDEQEGEVLACAPGPISGLMDESSVRRDFAADIAGGPAGELPASVVRTAVLEFDDATTARDAYDTALGWVLDCPGMDNVNRDAAEWAVVIDGGGQGEWRLRVRTAPEYCGDDCDAAVFDRMGVAQFGDRVVLVSLAEVGGPLEPEGLDASMEDLFHAAITKAGGEVTGGSSSGEATSVPEPGGLDFPLETGLRSADGDELTQEGPGPDVEGILLPDGFCGDSWPPEARAGRLALKQTGPEFGLWRELITFESADQAAAAVEGLRLAVEACPTLAGDEASEVTFVAHDVDSGYDDATFSYTYSEGLGGVVYQFVRVGHAVLATAQYGEWAPETTPDGARALNGENSQLTPLMCEYTEDGC